jgi:hypothetical protein
MGFATQNAMLRGSRSEHFGRSGRSEGQFGASLTTCLVANTSSIRPMNLALRAGESRSKLGLARNPKLPSALEIVSDLFRHYLRRWRRVRAFRQIICRRIILRDPALSTERDERSHLAMWRPRGLSTGCSDRTVGNISEAHFRPSSGLVQVPQRDCKSRAGFFSHGFT